MSKKKKIIPELRFPEFENDGEWTEKSIGSIANVSSGATPTSTEPTYWGGNIPWMNSGELNLKKVYSVANSITELGLKESSTKKIPPLCVLIGLAGQGKTRGTAAINYIELCTNQSIAAIHPNNINFDSEFLYHKIDSMYEVLRELSTGQGGRGGLNLSIIRDIEIPFPSISEQKKIASCLSSLDDLIEAHSQRLDILKDHKKGLMQNLFPQEGEKVPKYRFLEFENDGEWIFESFSKVYSFFVTNSFSRDNLNYNKGSIKNIHYGDIHTKFSTLFNIEKEDVPFINPDISLEKIKPENYCQISDMIFADASEDMDDVGKSIEIINLNDEKLLSGLHTMLARQIAPKLAIGFGGYMFKSAYIRKQIQKEAQGAKVIGISGTRLSGITIYFPKNKEEQKKIVLTISALDDVITAQIDKIELLKEHKKGLMQGLFPTIND